MTVNPAKRKCLTFGSENVTCVGETDKEQETCTFLWTVKKFSTMTNLLSSPVFRGSGGSQKNHSWQVLMNPKNEIEGTNYLSLYLKLVDFGHGDHSQDRSVEAHFQLYLLNADGTPIEPPPTQFYDKFKRGGVGQGKHKVISLTKLQLPSARIVVDDSIKILCEIWIYGEVKESVGNGGASGLGPSEEERTKIWEASLANDFRKLFKESIGSDVTVKTTNASFKAHKCVLMVRSPVFAAMFTAKMKEKKQNLVEITDFDDKVVEGMLEHLYTGQTDCMAEQADDLLKISDKYDLLSLKKDCEFVIADKLSKENAAVTLILAHAHNAPYLKQKAVDFINKNKQELLNSNSFVEAVKAHADVGLLTQLYFSQYDITP